jgi:hypothetical protein
MVLQAPRPLGLQDNPGDILLELWNVGERLIGQLVLFCSETAALQVVPDNTGAGAPKS